jgi:hypothetical protein
LWGSLRSLEGNRFSVLLFVIDTRFVSRIFHRTLFSLSYLILPISLAPINESSVLLTQFIHRFWSSIGKIDEERQEQKDKKRNICFGKLN